MHVKILFSLIFLSMIVFLNAHGQEGSRNLMAEYCANNWKVDPVKCADYISKDNQSQFNQATGQSLVQSSPSNDANRICPLGSYLGKDTFGNQACLDSHTNQFVASPNLNQIPSDSNGIDSGNNGMIAGVVILIIVVAIIAWITKSRKSPAPKEKVGRQGFSEYVKRQALQNQKFKCNNCGTPIGLVGARQIWFEFDHKDGNNWNDDVSNCQALCRNCHAYKTERDR